MLRASPRLLVLRSLFLSTLDGLQGAGAGSSPAWPLLSAGQVLDRASQGLISASREATDSPCRVTLVF